jgi:hypothetical protein
MTAYHANRTTRTRGLRHMSALGQKQTSAHVGIMSALPPKADIAVGDWHVRFVPRADIQTVFGYN